MIKWGQSKIKKNMISYYKLKKMGKKSRGGPKIWSKLSKIRKIDKILWKIGIICILTQKNTQKIIKWG